MRVIVVIIPGVLTAKVSVVGFKWATLAQLFLCVEEPDTAVGGVGSTGPSFLRTSNLSQAPTFVYDTPLIYLYKNYYCRCITFILMVKRCNHKGGLRFALRAFYSLFHSVRMHVSLCGAAVSGDVDLSNTGMDCYNHRVITPTSSTQPPLHCV